MNFGQVLLFVLAVVGVLFMIIQLVALVIGFVLARQITGAVHDLFTGTQHVRGGDFAHQIPVRARDQLGELAESFNLMTGEVTTLLGEMAEKGRLEQEMFAAREIQQKLLPTGPVKTTGLLVNAFCEPAREVAGDYYDFLPITDTILGVLIADVAGKGLAAGLYMAQLKVIVQSLSRLHHEPKAFLIAVNKVVSANLDGKSFITMTYGVIDVERREMTFARAGHCPLIHVPANQPAGMRKARMLIPDGLVVGLQIDDGTMFDNLLQEQTIAVEPGDLIVWFTDGISETMNEAFDCFGEHRLAQVVEQYAHLPFDQLRSYILAELRAFAGGADQHDDMTMILMKIESPAPPVLEAVATVLSVKGAGVNDSGLTVIFRTQSDIEANVVEALLDSHGVETLRTSGPTPGLFPFSLNPLGETAISVRSGEAIDAVRIIESHREQVGGGMVVPLPQEFDALEARVGYRFKDRGLLEHALTHKSKAHEDPSGGVADNESLEFLGDAVLGLIVAETLFRAFPTYNEGQKSKIKANLVSTASLAELAEQMGLGDHMILGRGEEKTGGRRKQALLADTCEALIAAIYLDGGLDPARDFLMREFSTGHRGRQAAGLLRPRSQVAPAGTAAGPGPAAAVVPRLGRSRSRPSQDVSRRGVRRRRQDRRRHGPDQEGSGAGSREAGAGGDSGVGIGNGDRGSLSCAEASRRYSTSSPPASDEEVRAASVQFVRKLSGFTAPSTGEQRGVHARDRRDRVKCRGGCSTVSRRKRRPRTAKTKR